MIRGVTIIIRLSVVRPDADIREQTIDVGNLAEDRHAELVAPFADNRLMPPNSTVPPSGTLTVVVTVTKENDGNCTVVPSLVVVVPVASCCGSGASWSSWRCCSVEWW